MIGVVIANQWVFEFIFLLALLVVGAMLVVPCCKFIAKYLAKAFVLFVAFSVIVAFLFSRVSNLY